MRFTSFDPDIETLYRRIRDGLLDLQPDFQRGEVWGRQKQQKLIDTILRNWHVPPIHVIKNEGSHVLEVLDGKQRLTAIYDFMNNEFPVDGLIDPLSPEVEALHGKKFSELPLDVRENFKRYPIRQFLIDNFEPEEPGELFFRLNSPTHLTAAEQRNAYYGEPRKQIKNLVFTMENFGIEKEFIGFSNSRMAYDDVLARVCYVFETKTLHKRITSRELSDRYRSLTPFSVELINQLDRVIRDFGNGKNFSHSNFRFNKATLFSWFVFLLVANKNLSFKIDASLQAEMLSELSSLREKYTNRDNESTLFNNSEESFLSDLFAIFEDRSRARVGNVDSVLIRDIMLWLVFLRVAERHNLQLGKNSNIEKLNNEFSNHLKRENSSRAAAENFLYEVIENENWGMRI